MQYAQGTVWLRSLDPFYIVTSYTITLIQEPQAEEDELCREPAVPHAQVSFKLLE